MDQEKIGKFIAELRKEKNVDFNYVMRFYMYDRFVEYLAKSNNKLKIYISRLEIVCFFSLTLLKC